MNIYEFHSNSKKLKGFNSRFKYVPDFAYELAKKYHIQHSVLEKIIAKSPKYSVEYAKHILKGPFPLGEKSIKLNARHSFVYARDVLKKRFPDGEMAISSQISTTVQYASSVLRNRWIEQEDFIFENRKIDEDDALGDIALIQNYFSGIPFRDNKLREKLVKYPDILKLFDNYTFSKKPKLKRKFDILNYLKLKINKIIYFLKIKKEIQKFK
jgi:hypothetical protein